MKNQNIKKIIVLILILGLFGCGFKLRGNYNIPDYLKKLTIVTDNTKKSFILQFVEGLNANGINTAIDNKLSSNNFSIELYEPTITQLINSYNSRGEISQYRLIAECNYKLFSNKSELIRSSNITRFRNYNINANQLLGNSSEKQVIVEELQLEIIDEILRHLSK